MKKIVFGVISAVVFIGLGGMYMYQQHQEKEKQEMIAIATSEEAKKVYEEFMKKRDPEAFTEKGVIKSYEIEVNSLYYNPMGGLEVRLYFNGDKELDFHFGLIEDDNGNLTSSGYTISPKLANILKKDE